MSKISEPQTGTSAECEAADSCPCSCVDASKETLLVEDEPQINTVPTSATCQSVPQLYQSEFLRLRLDIQKSPNESDIENADLRPVFYKTDGCRFDLDTTIKLNVNTAYKVSLNFRPVVRIERLEILDEVKVPVEAARDIESVTFETYFDTKSKQTSKRGERSKIHLALDLGEHGHLEYDIQAKFYAEKNTCHVSWGNALHQIELELASFNGEGQHQFDRSCSEEASGLFRTRSRAPSELEKEAIRAMLAGRR